MARLVLEARRLTEAHHGRTVTAAGRSGRLLATSSGGPSEAHPTWVRLTVLTVGETAGRTVMVGPATTVEVTG